MNRSMAGLGTPVAVDEASTGGEAVTAVVATMMERGRVPGLSMAVVDRDRLLVAGGHGSADLHTTRPAAASTAYLWFSMTKLVTATAALRLADEGRLDLHAPAGTYVDALRVTGPVQPTVRQLLDHTAGLGNPLPVRCVHPAGVEAPEPAALLRRVMSHRRIHRHAVGGAAHYTNVGYLALGEIITAASGSSFQDYVRTAVLEPLGMGATGFSHGPVADVATGYVRAPRIADRFIRSVLPAGVTGDRHGPYLALNPFCVDGPAYGGLIGDVVDAGRFLRMHLRDGELDGQRIIASETARRMRSIDQPGKPFDHGLGWFRRPLHRRGAVGRALRGRCWLLERHAPLPRAWHRHRRHEQQHHHLRLRTPLRPRGRRHAAVRGPGTAQEVPPALSAPPIASTRTWST